MCAQETAAALVNPKVVNCTRYAVAYLTRFAFELKPYVRGSKGCAEAIDFNDVTVQLQVVQFTADVTVDRESFFKLSDGLSPEFMKQNGR